MAGDLSPFLPLMPDLGSDTGTLKMTQNVNELSNLSGRSAEADAERVPVVFAREGQIRTSSREVANYFTRRHDDVLRAIRGLHCSADFRARNFTETAIREQVGAVLRDVPVIEMTKDGFAFLAMGFTGEKAGQFKEAYIAAFNAMDDDLRRRAPAERSITAEDLLANPIQLLTIAQAYAVQIQDLRHQVVEMTPAVKALDRIAGSDDDFGVRVAAKVLQMPERKFTDWLQRIGWAYRQAGNKGLLGYAEKWKQGVVVNRASPYTKPDGSDGVRDTLRITAKGLVHLGKKLGIEVVPGDIFSDRLLT